MSSFNLVKYASVLCFAFGNEVCGSLAAQPETEPAPPALEDEVLTAGLPGLLRHQPILT